MRVQCAGNRKHSNAAATRAGAGAGAAKPMLASAAAPLLAPPLAPARALPPGMDVAAAVERCRHRTGAACGADATSRANHKAGNSKSYWRKLK